MTKIPTEFNGQIGYQKVGFLNSYKNNEKYFAYEIETDSNTIKCKYLLDYKSSVWILNEKTYQEFANDFQIFSGGWYGYNSGGEWVGGRWRVQKRTFGKIMFRGVRNIITKKPDNKTKMNFNIKKPFFSNNIRIEISNNEIGELKFDCQSIEFEPSKKIGLFNKKANKFVDYTNKLQDNGLKLKE